MKNSDRYAPPEGYYNRTSNREPRELLLNAIKHVEPVRNKKALDIGAGAGAETRLLLQKGFLVTALDAQPEAKMYLSRLPNQENITVFISDVEDFEFQSFDLINAAFVLPFLDRQSFEYVLEKIKTSINPGGIFTGQFFGVNDDWNKPKENMTFLTKSEAKGYLNGLKVLSFEEKDQVGTVANGTKKHWHIFEFIAQK